MGAGEFGIRKVSYIKGVECMSEIIDYQKLCREIWHHNRLYYIEHQPEISDEEYDRLFAHLLKMEKEHPEWVDPSSPHSKSE